MSNRLKKGRQETTELPDSFFGKGTGLTIDDLPSVITKEIKVKKTYNFRKTSIEMLEKIAKDKKVAVGDILSDLIDKVV